MIFSIDYALTYLLHLSPDLSPDLIFYHLLSERLNFLKLPTHVFNIAFTA